MARSDQTAKDEGGMKSDGSDCEEDVSTFVWGYEIDLYEMIVLDIS